MMISLLRSREQGGGVRWIGREILNDLYGQRRSRFKYESTEPGRLLDLKEIVPRKRRELIQMKLNPHVSEKRVCEYEAALKKNEDTLKKGMDYIQELYRDSESVYHALCCW